MGGSCPDFSIADPNGRCTAYWDVADRQFTESDRIRFDAIVEAGKRGKSAPSSGKSLDMKFVEMKVRQKSKQFSKCGAVPGMLVLAEWAGAIHVTGMDVSVAFEGWPQIGLPLTGKSRSPLLLRSSDGRMVEQSVAGINNHIAAVAIVRSANIQKFKHGLMKFAERVFEKFADSEHAWGLVRQEEARQRSLGVDFDSKTTYLEVYRNRNAHYPWPTELHGPFDQVYDVLPTSMEPILTFDGLCPEREIPLPLSQTQLDIEAIIADPMFRSD